MEDTDAVSDAFFFSFENLTSGSRSFSAARAQQATAALRAKRASLRSSSFTTFTLGPDSDFYVYCRSPRLNCIDRYWVMPERSEPELPWWML